jgi:hypothetical protein
MVEYLIFFQKKKPEKKTQEKKLYLVGKNKKKSVSMLKSFSTFSTG